MTTIENEYNKNLETFRHNTQEERFDEKKADAAWLSAKAADTNAAVNHVLSGFKAVEHLGKGVAGLTSGFKNMMGGLSSLDSFIGG